MRGAGVLSLLAACSSVTSPRLEAVEPAQVSTLTATPAVVVGANLFDRAHVDLNGGPSNVDATWHVRVGATDVGDVMWRDPEHLGVTVPSGLAPGSYDVTAIAPDGRVAVLPSGLEVIAQPVGPEKPMAATLSIPALIGRATPFTVTMQVTNHGSAVATGVTPSALAATGTASITLLGAPPGPAAIAPGATATFTWSYQATTPGMVQLAGGASGIDADTGGSVVAPTVTSNVGDVAEALVVGQDPFGDGSAFAFTCGYHGQVVLGPNQTGTGAVGLAPDGSSSQAFSFTLPADTIGHRTTNNAAPPYPSIGATGCTQNTLACGPDNENGRATFTSVTVGGTEWLVASGAKSNGNYTHYLYMTPDTASPLGFRYVDLSSVFGDHVLATTAVAAVNGIVYVGAAANDGNRPRLVALQTLPAAPGLDATSSDVTDLKVQTIPGIQAGATDKIDSFAAFAGELYFANDGAWVRATVAMPDDYASTPSDWAVITPSASAYTQKTSRTSSKGADFTPIDRAVPQMAAFGGRLFVGRNTTTGPQLWSCDPTRTGDPAQCDAGDWSLVAANSASGDPLLSQFDDASLTSITLLVATASSLYVGYDSANGATVFRTANPSATTQADFEGAGGCTAAQHGSGSCPGYGGAGFGNPAVSRIFDGKALFGTVWITAGNGTSPVELVELP